MRLKLILFLLFTNLSAFLWAQKPPLNHSVYDSWQSVRNSKLSNDGQWIGYEIEVQEGDSNLYLSPLDSTKTLDFPRGEQLVFSNDSQFAAFLVKPFYKDIKAVKDKKKKKDSLAKDSLVIVNLDNLETQRIPKVKSFQIPEKGNSVIAYLIDSSKNRDDDKKGDDDKDKDAHGEPSTLVLAQLNSDKKYEYPNVISYQLSENGQSLAFITQKPEDKKTKKDKKKDEEETGEEVEAQPESENEKEPEETKSKDKSKPVKYPLSSVNIVETSTGKIKKLSEAEGNYLKLSLDKQGSQLVFLGTTSAKNDLVKDYQLHYFNQKTGETAEINNENTNLPKGWVISENKTATFSKDGKQVYFGIAPKPIPKDTALIANDHAIVDVWNYRDDELQTIQLKNLKKDLKKSYFAVFKTNVPSNFNVLQDETMDDVDWINDGNASYVLGSSSEGYRDELQWKGSVLQSHYIIDNNSGKKTEIVKHLNGSVHASPLGKFVVYFDREKGQWFSYNVEKRSTVLLNKNLDVSFTDEEFDMPDSPYAYGIATWTDQDESVIIKDRYDLWEFFLDGKKTARNITNGYGRKNKITFDTYQFDPEEKSINRKGNIYISAFNNDNKDEGFYSTTVDSGKDPQLVYVSNFWGSRSLKKAKNAEVYSFTKESYQDSPNLFVSNNFKEQKQLTQTNPQQSKYNWGSDELVHWTTLEGNQSTGVLYKPEDFDPNKKYPMVVYFYEKLSDNLNRYIAPSPTPSKLNISYFVSNGYLVFTPDISYEDGHPGKSAMEYINSGVEYLKKNNWVNSEKIGIDGQSWGGYQVAYLITQTDKYAAAWSGAPVVNMTSAYGGIRWGTGMNRQFQYERSQSRIGKTLWEDLDLYIENSPLFHLDKVQTPVVIMHNDRDGAVPWYQGIEMFTALKRLDKKVWLLNYNGDEHNLMKRQNRKDIQIRKQQFFDYYLKDAKAPVWMTRGIPATMKGKDWGFELTEETP